MKEKLQELKLKEVSAYDYQAVYDIFHMTIEGLEKYIETAGYYPDWQNRKQVRDNKTVVDGFEDAEKSFTVALFGFKKALRNTPPSLQGKIKEEYYKWINTTGIKVDNCPKRLKHWLFEINEVIEGKGDKFVQETASWAGERVQKMSDEEFSIKMNEAFASIQNPLNKEREVAESLKGQSWNQITLGSNFESGNLEQGRQAFDRIAGGVSSLHDKFDYHQRGRQQIRNPNYNPLIDDPSEEFLSSSSTTGSSSITQSNNPYVEVGNERELSPEQLGTIQQVNQELNQVANVPINELIPVASGGLAFMVGLAGSIRWFRKRNQSR